MPWTPAQHRLFEFAAHSPQKARAEGVKIPQAQAAIMAGEGIKSPGSPAKIKLVKALK